MNKLMEKYKAWRIISEEMLEDGFKGSIDCGVASVREDFSSYAELDNIISFEEMFILEKEYNGGNVMLKIISNWEKFVVEGTDIEALRKD